MLEHADVELSCSKVAVVEDSAISTAVGSTIGYVSEQGTIAAFKAS